MKTDGGLRWVDIADGTLRGDPTNPRNNQGSIAPIAASIRRFGFGAPVVARPDPDRPPGPNEPGGLVVIAGHTRLAAAVAAGVERVPVRVLDVTEAEGRALMLADNRLAEAATWNDDGLADLLGELQEGGVDLDGLGWDEAEIADLLGGGGGSGPNVDPPPPTAPPVVPVSRLGEIYELGPHRLICGDSTDPEIWTELMQSEDADALWTDPPYGVAIVGGNHTLSPEERRAAGGLEIDNDNLSPKELRGLLGRVFGLAVDHSKPGASWYVTGPPGPLFYEFATVLRDLGIWRWTLQWVKDSFVLGRADYHHRHEPIFYGWVPGAAHYFVDDRTQDTVLEVPRPRVNKEHPTMKPVELITRCLANSTKPGGLVVDPFGGSGSTLLAAAVLGRRCNTVEVDPRYCDVIRRRWTALAEAKGIDPGLGALVEGGADVAIRGTEAQREGGE